MILWKIYDEYEEQHYVVLTYESHTLINVGDKYVCTFMDKPSVQTCHSEIEANEANNGLERKPGLITIGANINQFCYKVQSIIKTDEEGYAPFYATVNPDLGCITLWRSDQGEKPVFIDDHWRVKVRPDTDPEGEFPNGIPDFSVISDMELADELGVTDPTKLYSIECEVTDWFYHNDYNIRNKDKAYE